MRTSTSFFAMTLAGAAAVASVVSLAPAASAGPFLGLGIGTAPTLRDDGQGISADSRSGRLMLGQRFSIVAVEGAVGGYQLADAANEYDAVSVSGGGRLHLPLQGPLSIFARAGVERTWLRVDNMDDYDGNGFYGGLGAELRLALPLGETAVWVDYSQHRVTLDNGGDEIDGDTSMWTAGISVGI